MGLMEYVESHSTDPRWNLALEEYLFTSMDQTKDYFMLWQNDNTVVVGKNQNVTEEVNEATARINGVTVVRRMSGGGAVYHDLGNLNFTFITDAGRLSEIDFFRFCRPVAETLRAMGVPAEINGRNDLTVHGKKFSGSAQWIQGGRVLHHGTLLFRSDLERAAQVLRAGAKKVRSSSIKSVPDRIVNIGGYFPEEVTLERFKGELCRRIMERDDPRPLELSQKDLEAVRALKRNRYDTWEWNYGRSPKYETTKERWFPQCGFLTLDMRVEEGVIRELQLLGDFFGNGDVQELAAGLTGCRVDYEQVLSRLEELPLSWYIKNMEPAPLAKLIVS